MGPILHVDMDAFFASIEQRDRPSLRGKPVVVGAPPDRRGVVSTASYEARAYGIHSAMPSRTAARLCPHAVFLPVRGEVYGAVSDRLMEILGSFTPMVEPVSVDEAFLDLSGTRLLWPDPVALARAIKQRIAGELGLTASVGLAPNKFLAKLASDLEKPDGLTVVPAAPGELLAFLAPMPVGRIWGVGQAGEARLHRFGLRTFGDVQAREEAEVRRWLGDSLGAHVWRLARGIDDRPVETVHEARSVSAEHTYPEDCTDPEAVRRTLIELTEKVGRRLRRAGLMARTGHLKLRDGDFRTQTRQRALPAPTHADAELLRCALELFEAAGMRRPVRLVGFGASRFDDPGGADGPVQGVLFDERRPAAERSDALDRAVDEVRERFGRDALKRGGP